MKINRFNIKIYKELLIQIKNNILIDSLKIFPIKMQYNVRMYRAYWFNKANSLMSKNYVLINLKFIYKDRVLASKI